MAAFVGTYSDGKTAARHDVNVTLGPLGLMISGPTVAPTSWPMADLRVLPTDRRDEPLRLTRRTNDELRLVVPDPQFRVLLFRQTPALDPRHGRVGRTAAIIGGSLAAAAALAALFWFGLPLISKPLAAAIPPAVETRIGAAIGDILIGSQEVCENPAGEEALDTLVDRVLAASMRRSTSPSKWSTARW